LLPSPVGGGEFDIPDNVGEERGRRVRNWSTIWLWPVTAFVRLRGAVRQYWKRVLVGAFVGWVFAVIGGAFALANLEFWGLVSENTSDTVGIATPLAGVGLGALIAYAGRSDQRPSGVMTRR
jgi:hypothetical protein